MDVIHGCNVTWMSLVNWWMSKPSCRCSYHVDDFDAKWMMMWCEVKYHLMVELRFWMPNGFGIVTECHSSDWHFRLWPLDPSLGWIWWGWETRVCLCNWQLVWPPGLDVCSFLWDVVGRRERTDVARSIATSNGPDLHASGQRLCSVACYILGLGLGLGLDNWFCPLFVWSSSSSSFGAAERGVGGKEVRTWCGKRRRKRWRGEKEVSKQREVAMRLITHNMLSCNIKGVTNGYPLGIEASRLETKESELNPEFLRKIFPKLEWKALRDAAHSVCVCRVFFFSFFALSARLHWCCWAIRSFGKRFLHMRISSRNPKFYPMPCSFPFAEGLLDREPFWQVEIFWGSQVRVVCEQKECNNCGRNYYRRSRMESSFASLLKFSCLRGLQLGLNDLPEHVEPSMLEDEDFLKNFHHALLEVSLPILLFLVAMLASQQMSFDHYNIVQFLT